MPESDLKSPMSQLTHKLLKAETAAVIAVTVLSILLSAHFQITEALYAHTRRLEYFQLDELPIGLLVLAIGLIWLSWRRNRQAVRELHARQLAEARLAGVLAENRKLAQEHLRIQELERKHLARELHDQLGQSLNVIKLDAVSICNSGENAWGFSSNAAQEIIRTVDHMHGAVNDMIGRLRPVGLDELGLVAAIEHCVDQWHQRLPKTHFSLVLRGDFDRLSESLTLTLYRLIQEGLTNIYKHADAGRVEIVLQRLACAPPGSDELLLTLADDGRGMAPGADTSGYGLSGMRERVEMVGGTFSMSSAPDRGFSFEARLPARGE